MNDYIIRTRTPLVIWVLTGAIVAAHVLYTFAPHDVQDALAYTLAIIPIRFEADGPAPFEHWYEMFGPIFGHVFLHVAWWHVGLNAFFILLFGRLPALRLGVLRFLTLFFLSAAGGAALYIAVNWHHQDAIAVGASGALCGVFSAYFLAARPTWREALADPAIRGPLITLFVLNVVVMGVIAQFGAPIAWEGHLGGFIVGAIVYVLFERPAPQGAFS